MLLATVLLVGLALLDAIAASPTHAASVVVDIKDLAYGPSSIQIVQGDTVTWTDSEEIMPHDVTSGAPGQPDPGLLFGSEILLPGQSFEATFPDVGEFAYFCKLHPTMTGVVIVLPS
jgi:plastocyanin